MCEPGGELLHLAFGPEHFFFDQHLEVSADHLVTVFLCRFVVTTGHRIFGDLPEYPRIRGRRTSDHHCITSSLTHHGASVLGRANVTVADYRNPHCLLYRSNPIPSRLAAVALFAGPSVERHGAQAAILGHLSQFHADDLLFIPARAKLYGKRNLHRRAHSLENPPNRWQV